MEEGNHTKDEYLTFHVPPDLNCKADKCSYVRVYFSDGRPMYEGAIPKGGATLKLSMQELLNKEKFELSDRGFYGVSIELIFTGLQILFLILKAYFDSSNTQEKAKEHLREAQEKLAKVAAQFEMRIRYDNPNQQSIDLLEDQMDEARKKSKGTPS
ncbi:unnamed protein product [Sphagnum tenellum]